MSKLLSGEKMVIAHSKTNYELPSLGVKDFEPNHSWLEEKQIQSALDHRKTLLETERVEKESNLMVADWKAEKHKAAVTRKGKHWETFGHHSDNTDWLFPEEVLFLMEMGCLECLFSEVPLSIQKAYSVLLKPENGCSIEEYRVFAHLCRTGYRVLRHLPNLTVTAYERTIRLDQHLAERKTYSNVNSEKTELDVTEESRVSEANDNYVTGTELSSGQTDIGTDKTELSTDVEELETEETPDLGKEKQLSKKLEIKSIDKTLVSTDLEEMVTDDSSFSRSREKVVEENQMSKKLEITSATDLEEMVTHDLPQSGEKTVEENQLSPKFTVVEEKIVSNMPETSYAKETQLSNQFGKRSAKGCEGLTKRQLRKMQRNLVRLGCRQAVKASVQNLKWRKRRKRWLQNVQKKCKKIKLSTDEPVGHGPCDISSLRDSQTRSPELPSERWQPPVVISDLPENIEMTIGSTGVQTQESDKDQDTIEVIDIADTSSEDTDDEEESDSDIEIIQEIRPQSHEEENVEEDDFEIIEVPVPKKEIIVETLSSDSEVEEEEEDGSGSESERSYDGNWKRNRQKKKRRFIRPPTMSHFSFAAVDEFCEEKLSKDKINREGNSNLDGNNAFIALESRKERAKRPVFQINMTRNEILDLMPTMAGQHKKLMTLDIPDSRLVPEGVSPKQQSYTYSTNVLRAKVFRQGYRGRRNFHGPRFTSFNPYYNPVGNFHPNFGGPQGLFQAPQLTQLWGTGDFTSVARRVMQITSTLLMNMPQNNMNNGILPYHPRPHFPVTPNFPRIESPTQFPPINQNFSHSEPLSTNHRGLNFPQRNNANLVNLFDMPSQRDFGTPNHIRFPDISSSPVIENDQSSLNFSVDLSQNSERDFDSSDCNFAPTVGNSCRANRNNCAANFRSRRGRFPKIKQIQRGGFSHRNSREGALSHQFIDPAYIKSDVPITDPQDVSDYIPISSSSSNQKSIEIISIDDNDDKMAPRGISHRFTNSKERRRELVLVNLKKQKKRRRRKPNSKIKTPEIVFLDNPSISETFMENSIANSVKQENKKSVQVKTESLKMEEPSCSSGVKKEAGGVKVEKDQEVTVKSEGGGESRSSNVRVKVEQSSGQNVSVEIKIESVNDTSSVVSLPLANLVKEEPQQIKQESECAEVKAEVKTETLVEPESKEGDMGITERNSANIAETEERSQSEPMESEFESARQNVESIPVDHTDSNCELENQLFDTEERNLNSEMCRGTKPSSENDQKKVSSWAEIKKNNLPLSAFQNTESENETEDESRDEEETRPILRPKHCKTIGTVLSALQIFTPASSSQPNHMVALKISFDLYLPTEFKKSHRGLPQYRIVVFSESEPLPSPAQLREVNTRFQDRVPVLTAVVAPGSLVFYTFSDIDLPQDFNSYVN